jgi:pimeloyl-ACP methyl ester carboxylesterase
MNRRRYQSIWQELSDFLRIMVLALSAALFLSGLMVDLTLGGTLLIAAQLFFSYGTLCQAVRAPLRRLFMIGSPIVAVGVLISNIGAISYNPLVRVESTSGATFSQNLNLLIREEDGIKEIFKLLSLIRFISSGEAEGLFPALSREYSSLRERRGHFPSPLTTTFLGLERPGSFNKVTFPLPNNEAPTGTVVFLHGTGGNWTLICSIVADMVAPLKFQTICPSTNPLGGWTTANSVQIVSETISAAQKSGGKIYLAGISAGAVGTGFLAQRYQKNLSGVILISGVVPGLKDLDVDTLLITGERDERFTQKIVDWALRQNHHNLGKVEHRTISGDHMAIIKQKGIIESIVREWLSNHGLH